MRLIPLFGEYQGKVVRLPCLRPCLLAVLCSMFTLVNPLWPCLGVSVVTVLCDLTASPGRNMPEYAPDLIALCLNL